MENNSGNVNQGSLSNLNSPSKIPAPRSRGSRSIFNGDSALAPLAPPVAPNTSAGIGQKRKQLERSPPKNPVLGGSRAAQAAQSTIASANVRTYRANATGTTRPPVTKTSVAQRGNTRNSSNANAGSSSSSSLFNEALSEIEQIAGNKKRPNWDTRVSILRADHELTHCRDDWRIWSS